MEMLEDDLESKDKILEPPDQSAQEGHVVLIPLSDLYPFPNQPFKVRDDDSMKELVESVRVYGVVTPAIVRPRDAGGYEILAGHRRRYASELAGIKSMPAVVRELDNDIATILMVDSNLQREEILPSEKAKAYKMKLDAIKRRAGRPTKGDAENSRQLVGNFESAEIIGRETGESGRQIQRYIRLTELSPSLQQMVDEKKIGLTSAVELSYLKPEEQAILVKAIDSEQATPSLSQAQQMKKLSQTGELDQAAMFALLRGDNPRRKPEPKITLPLIEKPPHNQNKMAKAPAKKSSPANSSVFTSRSTKVEPSVPPVTSTDDETPEHCPTIEEIVAQLKDPNKDCRCTPDMFLNEFTAFAEQFTRQLNCYRTEHYEAVFPKLGPTYLSNLRRQIDLIRDAVDEFYHHIKGANQHE